MTDVTYKLLFDEDEIKEIHPAMDYIDSTLFFGLNWPTERDVVTDKGSIKSKEKALAFISGKNEFFCALDPEEMSKRNLFLKFKPMTSELRFNKEGIFSFRNNQYKKTTKELFDELRGVVVKYMDLSNSEEYSLLPIWWMGTYFYKVFKWYPLIWLWGTKRAGKSKLADITRCLAFNAILSPNMSNATVYRLVQHLRPTLIIDEAESLADEKRSAELGELLNAGCYDGGVVYRAEKTTKDKIMPICFEVYCPKMLCNIKGINADAIIDRSIRIIMQRTKKKEVAKMSVSYTDPEWQWFRNDLYCFALKNVDNVIGEYEKLENKSKEGSPILQSDRAWDIWKPLFAIAKVIDEEVYDELIKLAQTKEGESIVMDIGDSLDEDLTYVLWQTVKEERYYKVSDIKDSLIEHKSDYSKWLNERTIGRALTRLGLGKAKRRIGSGIEYFLSPAMVKDLAERQGILLQPTQTAQTTLKDDVVNEVNEEVIQETP